jgi:hypothetical protein
MIDSGLAIIFPRPTVCPPAANARKFMGRALAENFRIRPEDLESLSVLKINVMTCLDSLGFLALLS